nr:hypothetical protein [Bacteroidota bacterium]
MKYLRVDADMVGGKIKPLWQSKRPVWLKDNMLKMLAVLDYGDSPLKIEAFSMMLYGANMACKREIIDKYGNFSTKLGVSGGKLSGFEDTEFFFRLVENGAIAYYVPEMVVYHKIPSTRCQKKYFTKWAVDRSYSNVEYDLLCTDKIKKHQVYGVPRWLYKKMFISFVNWLVNRMFNSADFSFEYKLIMLGNMSMIRAYRDLNKKK